MDTSKVTRLEIIDHLYDQGRVLSMSGEPEMVKVELSLQDDGRTLKVFLSKRGPSEIAA